jgi:hypothetical protein
MMGKLSGQEMLENKQLEYVSGNKERRKNKFLSD